jgi:HK97 family phage major capsid protein
MPTQNPANPTPKQTDAEKNQILNRQIEILERAAKGELDGSDEQIRSARNAVKDAMIEVRNTIATLQAQVDEGKADLNALREARAEEQRLSEKFNEATLAMLDARQRGGPNANLRHFGDERLARLFALECMRHCKHGQSVIARNERMRNDVEVLTRELTGLPGSGDAFVQEQFDNTIEGTVFKFTVLPQYVRQLPMPEKKITMRRRGDRVRGYRFTRGNAPTPSDVGEPELFYLDAEDYGALSYVNNFLLDDNNLLPSIGDMIVEDMADSIAEMWEDEALNGVAGGAVANWPYNPGNYYFDGMLNASEFAHVTGQSATRAGISFEDYLTLFGSLERTHAGAARLHVDRSMVFSLRGKKDNEGNFIWAPAVNGAPGTIMGEQYEWGWRRMPRRGDPNEAGKPCAMYGDLRKAYYAGIRKGFSVEESKEFAFDTNETAFRGLARAAMTPGHYTDALVVLDTAAA